MRGSVALFCALILNLSNVYAITVPPLTRVINNEELRANSYWGELIVNSTTPNDKLLFVGNSVSYVYEIVKNARVSHQVLISGRWMKAAKEARSYEDIMHRYCSIIIDPLDLEGEDQQGRIVVVDFSTSGDSVVRSHTV
jgi:hypothetical protein